MSVLLPVAVFLCLSLYRCADITGIHGDEAWVFLHAESVLEGARPWSGMNFYTGALNLYVSACALWLGDHQFWSLRAAGGIFNALALAFLLNAIRLNHPREPMLVLWTGLLIATSASFVAFSRFAVELTVLTPLLVCAALYFLALAGKSAGRTRKAAALAGGAALGLAAYNHGLGYAIVGALLVGARLTYGEALYKATLPRFAAFGFVAGLAPRFAVLLMEHGAQTAEAAPAPVNQVVSPQAVTLLARLTGFVLDAMGLPGQLIGQIDGNLVFMRFTGENLVPVLPLFSVALVSAGLWRWRLGAKWSDAPADKAMLLAWAAAPLIILFIAPGAALRYFEIPALFACYVLALTFAAIWRSPKCGVAGRRIVQGVLALLVLSQSLYVAADYFYAFDRSGGRLAAFRLGARLRETSYEFARMDDLYRELRASGAKRIYAPVFLGWDLAVLDHRARSLDVVALKDDEAVAPLLAQAPPDQPAALVFINADLSAPLLQLDLSKKGPLAAGGRQFERKVSEDGKFLIYLSRP